MSDDCLNDEDLEIPEITDFSGGVVGKYYERYSQGTNVVFIDPDLVTDFPDSASVNRALRRVLQQRRRRGVRGVQAPGTKK